MDRIDKLEAQSIYIIREAYKKFKRLGVLWSIGKDSTVLLWLIQKAFFGHCPFPVIHVDTTFKFPEMYEFRKKWSEKWDLDLIVETNDEALENGVNYDNCDATTCCHKLKTVPLKNLIDREGFEGLILGIRGDEEGSRGKERFFSKRDEDFEWDYTNQPPELWNQFKTDFEEGDHIRVHPILSWSEVDIWRYIQREDIPTVSLYFAEDGERYRSLGCMPITQPMESDADTVQKIIDELEETKISERSGRDQDKESSFSLQRLRAKGYM